MATSPPPLIPVQPKTWALCAVCHKSGSRRVIAEGTEAEMESVFDLIVRRGYGLQIIDSDGSLHCTTAGPVYVPDPAPDPSNRPEANADSDVDLLVEALRQLEDRANRHLSLLEPTARLIDALADLAPKPAS